MASITPTSRFGTRRIIARIPHHAKMVIVEYGPGDGPITKAILAKMPPTGLLIAIESNADFVKQLTAIKDPRLKIIHGRSENIKTILREINLKSVDCVISGIPFSLTPKPVAERLVADTAEILKPGGRFLVYQFRHGVSRLLARHFHLINKKYILLNLPPLWLFEVKK